jgi:hypothetical protein
MFRCNIDPEFAHTSPFGYQLIRKAPVSEGFVLILHQYEPGEVERNYKLSMLGTPIHIVFNSTFTSGGKCRGAMR